MKKINFANMPDVLRFFGGLFIASALMVGGYYALVSDGYYWLGFIMFLVLAILVWRNVWRQAKQDEYRKAAAMAEETERLKQSERQRSEDANLRRRAREEEAKQQLAENELILVEHRDLVDKFLEITERKVSILDEYGDENWDVLPKEIEKCLTKMAKRQQKAVYTYRYLFGSLQEKFRGYHEARKHSVNGTEDISNLTGLDFEVYLSKLLKKAGFESVTGTPATGDQGADLIGKKNGKTIAIQAKGYRGAVGNGAVQEIVGAIKFYNADEGWVITNSTFTASARSLAQANNIKLIDGHDLKDFAALSDRL